jgi:catechol 2,3-dioxygenase-like lactoylglutathione lyase family enzyme
VHDNSIDAKLSLMFELEGLDHVAVTVSDVERSAAWYIDVLGFDRQHDEAWHGTPVFVGQGKAGVALFPTKRNASAAAPSREAINMLHFAWRADRKNFVRAQEELKRRGIEFSFQDHEISHSIYFRDPDGHEIEITTYELE